MTSCADLAGDVEIVVGSDTATTVDRSRDGTDGAMSTRQPFRRTAWPRSALVPAPPLSRLSRYWLLVCSILASLATVFLAVEALDITALSEPSERIEAGGPESALLAVGLLVADALVPVASSVVMFSLGAAYGALVGGALAWLGRFGMALLGFAIGRWGSPAIARIVGDAERARADAVLERRGALAIVVTRPVPLLAEAVVILAGASSMRWRHAVIAAAIGSLPEAIAYGLAGGVSATFGGGAFIWVGFLAVAGGFWLAGRRTSRGGETDDGRRRRVYSLRRAG